MNLINRTWKRVLICLIFAGILSEGISNFTNREVEISALFLGIILYFVLSNVNNRAQKEKSRLNQLNQKTVYRRFISNLAFQ